jgi:geranylgeranyl pyrophosphate synthase
LLSLAGSAVARVVEDGASATTGVALADLFGTAFAQAADGQARNLQRATQTNPLLAYQQAAAKSGPLGSLITRLGARTATENLEIVELLGEFGRRQAVRSQLLNDARDAGPDAAHDKSDVRVGARTVPLAFVGSRGAPRDLDAAALGAWEAAERLRVAAGGGLATALALAEAERLAGLDALNRLEQHGCDVTGLRQLI